MHGSRVVARFAECLLEIVAPSRCAACGEISREPFCVRCGPLERASVETLRGLPLITLGAYESPLKEAIARFKFGGHPELATPLARLFDEALAELSLDTCDVFVPVPLHVRRLVERGYNQSALLAGALARRHRARFLPRLLERTRETDQQAKLPREARGENVHGAFRVRASALRQAAKMSGRVLLVDDVVTTGATLSSCLTALEASEFSVFALIALARAGTA